MKDDENLNKEVKDSDVEHALKVLKRKLKTDDESLTRQDIYYQNLSTEERKKAILEKVAIAKEKTKGFVSDDIGLRFVDLENIIEGYKSLVHFQKMEIQFLKEELDSKNLLSDYKKVLEDYHNKLRNAGL